PAYPIAEDLRRAGFAVERLVLYQTESGVYDSEGRPLSQAARRSLGQQMGGVICFASPSAVRGFCQGIGDLFPDVYARLRAVAIGTTTEAEANRHFSQVKTIETADRRLLFAVAKDWK